MDSPVVTPRTGVGTALRLLDEHDLPGLPVAEGSRLLGMVYERDLLRLAPSQATTLDAYELHDVLERLTVGRALKPTETLCADASLQEALLFVGRKALEAVPVVAEGRFLGLLTPGPS
jgi:acetoin utilization protein AcuB